jgi:hypothetical protein
MMRRRFAFRRSARVETRGVVANVVFRYEKRERRLHVRAFEIAAQSCRPVFSSSIGAADRPRSKTAKDLQLPALPAAIRRMSRLRRRQHITF